MSSVENIIDLPATLEVKRALAVNMILFDVKTEAICALLTVSDAFVSKWKIRFENEGAEALKLNDTGGMGLLTEDPRDESLFHLSMQPPDSVEARRDYLEYYSGVVYHSKPSYDDLLNEARRSWHQTPAATPNREEAPVWQKQEESKTTLAARQAAIVSGEVIVWVEEECHVGWGDAIGYGWGRPHERTAVPVATGQHRQRSDGVMNLYNQGFILSPDERGKGASPVFFIESLQGLHPAKQWIFIWDRASSQGSEEVQTYLKKVNQGLDEKEWTVTCRLFAPKAPDQNPVEAVWLQGKNFLRRHVYENKTFQQVKRSFFNFLNKKVFNFKKSNWYLEIPQPV